jgi:16S rRNA (cytosine1402-N4)-methyltransferase
MTHVAPRELVSRPRVNIHAYHEPVMVEEVLGFLGGARSVLDATLGGGGHTAALLARGAHVVGIDRDPASRSVTAARFAAEIAGGTLQIVASNFADAATSDAFRDAPFDGILLDLGVSSHQFDDATRGFTFREGAPLDMRMGGEGMTAADWLNRSTESEIARVFRDYADEPRARRLAHVIADRRAHRPFATSDDLVRAIRGALGPRTGPADFARLFQAVRIVVNDELSELERALPALRDRLAPEGVLVVISYHSGEDRLVKRAFQNWSRACVCPPRQPICTCGGVAKGETLTRRPVEANAAEVERNVRARSARLRAWQKAVA